MSDPFADRTIPRAILWGGAGLVLLSLFIVGFVRITGEGVFTPEYAPVAETRQLRFLDRSEGGVAVIDVQSRAEVKVLEPGQDGFIRATVRTLAQERMRRGLGAELAFELRRHDDGSLSLHDPATGRTVSLEAFGSTNRAAFASLLER